MEYKLIVRALLNVNKKQQAIKHAERIFDDLSPKIKEKDWRNERFWEIECHKTFEYKNDRDALYETMKYFFEISREWKISGPREEQYDVLLSGFFSDDTDQMLISGHYELFRNRK